MQACKEHVAIKSFIFVVCVQIRHEVDNGVAAKEVEKHGGMDALQEVGAQRAEVQEDDHLAQQPPTAVLTSRALAMGGNLSAAGREVQRLADEKAAEQAAKAAARAAKEANAAAKATGKAGRGRGTKDGSGYKRGSAGVHSKLPRPNKKGAASNKKPRKDYSDSDEHE